MSLFGQYLVDQGIITLDQLNQAVEYQKEANKSFGAICLEHGYLNEADLDEIVREQLGYRSMSIGEVAVFLGKLDDEQVMEIARIQKQANLPLGTALIELGMVEEGKLDDALAHFEEIRTQW